MNNISHCKLHIRHITKILNSHYGAKIRLIPSLFQAKANGIIATEKDMHTSPKKTQTEN